jgi:tRNA (guanine-N7-)-methyltransferase
MPAMKKDTPQIDAEENLTQRRIRSYVLRQGRLTKGQEKALADHWPNFGIDYCPEVLDLSKTFSRLESIKILEIGFGMGETTAKIAQSMPEHDFLGVEVHTPGVGGLLKLIGENSLKNVRIIQHDVVDVLNNMIADTSLDGVHIFFPDPWHKKRHHKRRLIQAEFVKLICSKLKPSGYLHVATDWQEYAEWVLDILKIEPLLTNSAKDYAPKPAYRPLTKFENRGIKLGHGVWDLIFIRK